VEHVRVLLAALRALQACCVAAGFVKYPANQEIVCELVYGGMAALVGLLTDETQPAIVRAETAHVLGCVALGKVNQSKIHVKVTDTCYTAAQHLVSAQVAQV